MTTRPRCHLAVVGFAALSLAAAGCLQPSVARVVDGRAVVGDFVASEAYAAYARAAIAEREGRLEDAARDYAAAADDAEDPSAYARLGATLCALGRVDDARRAFAEGLERDERAAVVHRERARCALARDALTEASHAAQRAVVLDPGDRESRALLEMALRRAGRTAEADALLDEARAARAPVRPPRVTAPGASSLPASIASPGADLSAALRQARPTRDDVDQALALGARAEAARLATAARMPPSDLAARALAHGHREWAGELARRALTADPDDATAWAVAVAAGAPPGSEDEAAIADVARSRPSGAPSPLAALLVAELVLRRGGPDAALAWVAPAALDRVREDQLEERVRLRLRAAMP